MCWGTISPTLLWISCRCSTSQLPQKCKQPWGCFDSRLIYFCYWRYDKHPICHIAHAWICPCLFGGKEYPYFNTFGGSPLSKKQFQVKKFINSFVCEEKPRSRENLISISCFVESITRLHERDVHSSKKREVKNFIMSSRESRIWIERILWDIFFYSDHGIIYN